ncbi:MAG TPA: DUF2273 domain-containing protein [Firmicutes bacterium]|jgi:uncharacterized membrane protein|nr:DUF2273 domain-containing protein [Bacillota bacterium]
MKERLAAVLSAHMGKIFGSLLGLIVGWIFIAYGVLKGLFVVLCIAAGVFFGAVLDSPKGSDGFFGRFLR